MTDQWVPAPPPTPQPPNGLAPANTWTPAPGCSSADSPSIADGVIITGRPAVLSAMPWQITLNDGGSPANFSIDHFDASGALIESPILIEGSDGDVMLTHDPTQPLGAATKQYVDANVVPGVVSWNGRQGVVTMTSTDVMVALGYSPYDAANPANYQNAAQVQAAINFAVPQPSNSAPTMDGVAAPGLANQWSRWDHVHPSDTTKLSLSGGTLTGGLVAPALVATSGIAGTSGGAPPNLFSAPAPADNSLAVPSTGWVNAAITARGYIPDAPSDGQFYARQNAAWAIPPGGMTDAPNDGTAYARKSAAWAHLTHTDITDWTASLAPYALTASVPIASSMLPLANGVAAVGTSTNYARADHVHPITMGDNRIINGNFAINQRGYASGAALAAAAYGHDRWKAGASGCTYTFAAAVPDTTVTITAGTLTQIIEAGMIEGGVYTLSWTGTAQARVYQGTPTGAYAASPIVTSSLPAGVNTVVEFNAGTVVRAKLEIGSVATPFNRQSLAKSLADCQRYYQTNYLIMSVSGQAAGGVIQTSCPFVVGMRAAPTLAILNNSSSNISSFAIGVSGSAVYSNGTATAAGGCTVNCNFSASAEL